MLTTVVLHSIYRNWLKLMFFPALPGRVVRQHSHFLPILLTQLSRRTIMASVGEKPKIVVDIISDPN